MGSSPTTPVVTSIRSTLRAAPGVRSSRARRRTTHRSTRSMGRGSSSCGATASSIGRSWRTRTVGIRRSWEPKAWRSSIQARSSGRRTVAPSRYSGGRTGRCGCTSPTRSPAPSGWRRSPTSTARSIGGRPMAARSCSRKAPLATTSLRCTRSIPAASTSSTPTASPRMSGAQAGPRMAPDTRSTT